MASSEQDQRRLQLHTHALFPLEAGWPGSQWTAVRADMGFSLLHHLPMEPSCLPRERMEMRKTWKYFDNLRNKTYWKHTVLPDNSKLNFRDKPIYRTVLSCPHSRGKLFSSKSYKQSLLLWLLLFIRKLLFRFNIFCINTGHEKLVYIF